MSMGEVWSDYSFTRFIICQAGKPLTSSESLNCRLIKKAPKKFPHDFFLGNGLLAPIESLYIEFDTLLRSPSPSWLRASSSDWASVGCAILGGHQDWALQATVMGVTGVLQQCYRGCPHMCPTDTCGDGLARPQPRSSLPRGYKSSGAGSSEAVLE